MGMEAWASVDATSQNSGHRCRRFNQVVSQSLRKVGDRGPCSIACCSQGEAVQGNAGSHAGRLSALSACHRHTCLPSSRFPHSCCLWQHQTICKPIPLQRRHSPFWACPHPWGSLKVFPLVLLAPTPAHRLEQTRTPHLHGPGPSRCPSVHTASPTPWP